MSDASAARLQELFLAALEVPAEQRHEWLARHCGDDQALQAEVRELLEYDERPDDPLEQGLDQGVLVEAGLLDDAPQGVAALCPHCQHRIDLPTGRGSSKVVCDSCGGVYQPPGKEETTPIRLESLPPGPGGEQAQYPNTLRVYDSKSHRVDRRLSRYRRTELHARGGLGVVFRARDMELKRTVALKEILPDQSDNPQFQERFVFEAEVTGSLEHPGIVPVYGMGRYADNRPYYAMRFIRGHSFRAAIQRFHKENPGASSAKYYSRSFRMLLGRLTDACNAVHYAHEHGVLHRDIKPDNIMLGDYGETLVVDWGLAKLVESDHAAGLRADSARIEVSGSGTRTSQGSEIGTPTYMSPEQAAGEHDRLDSRTDVYSLGAVLFTIITGEYSVEGSGRHQIVANVREGKIRNIPSLAPAAPRALISICRKAMEHDPAQRYPTAVAMAIDIDRWMSDEAVLAHAAHETLLERAGRWLRRYRTWTISSAAALLVITAIAVMSALLISNARHKEAIARMQAQASKTEAVARYRDARRAIDTWLVQSSDALEFFPETKAVRRRLLQLASDEYQRLAASESDDGELKLEQGRVLVRLGDLATVQRAFQTAGSHYQEAMNLFAAYSGDVDLRVPFEAELGNVHTRLGMLLRDQEQLQQAGDEFRTAIDHLNPLVEESSDSLARRYLASAYINQAVVSELLVDFEGAIESLKLGRMHYERLDATTDSETHLALAHARELLGRILARTGRHEQAMAEFNESINSLTRLVNDKPDQPHQPDYRDHPEYLAALASAHISAASSLRDRGMEDQALDSYRSALKHHRALRKAIPDDPRYTEYVGISLTDLGLVQHEAGLNRQAEASVNEALEIFLGMLADYPGIPRCHEHLATCQDVLGQVRLDRSPNPQDAITVLTDATDALQFLIAKSPDRYDYFERYAVAMSHRGRALHRQNEFENAGRCFAEAISILQQLTEGYDLAREAGPAITAYWNALANTHYFYGLMLSDQGQSDAHEHFKTARDTWIALADQQTPRDKHHLAWLLATCPDPSVQDIPRAIEHAAAATTLAPKNARFVTTEALASVLAEQPAQALALLDRVKLLRGTWIDRDWFVLAMAQHQVGQQQQARESLARGVTWMEDQQPFNADIQLLRDAAEAFLEK